MLNQTYNLKLKSSKLLFEDTLFQVDGYSSEPPILCEIYARVGEMKIAHHNKISKDILKMLLRNFVNNLYPSILEHFFIGLVLYLF